MTEKIIKSTCVDCGVEILLFEGHTGRCTECFEKEFMKITGRIFE